MKMNFNYRKIKQVEGQRLEQFLTEVQNMFAPPLFERIQSRSNTDNINQYVNKVLKNAITIICEFENEIVGVIILYANDFVIRTAYIPILVIKNEFEGNGIASNLLKIATQEAIKNNMVRVTVKTWKKNTPAINLYKKNGFDFKVVENDILFSKNL